MPLRLGVLPVVRLAALILFLSAAPPAGAGQAATPRPEQPADPHRIEVAVGTWYPAPALTLSANDRGIAGTAIDLRNDLQMSSSWVPDVQVRLWIARRHAFRFEYLPIASDGQTALPRDVVYLGQVFRAGAPVRSTLDWRVHRFGYEFDVVKRRRVSAGVNLEVRNSDLRLGLTGSGGDTLGRSHIPMPVVGGLVRVQVQQRLSLTGEAAAFAVPDNAEKTFGGRFVDASGYATLSLARGVAARGGVRSIDIRHLGRNNQGRGRLTGLYLAAVFSR